MIPYELLKFKRLFFLKYAGELRIIALRRKKGKRSPKVHTDKDYTRAFARRKKQLIAQGREVVKSLAEGQARQTCTWPRPFPT
jgi:hypothetical protein